MNRRPSRTTDATFQLLRLVLALGRVQLVMLGHLFLNAMVLQDGRRESSGTKPRRGLDRGLLLVLVLHRRGASERWLLGLRRHRQVVLRVQTWVVHSVDLMGMVGRVVAAITRVAAVQLNSSRGTVGGRSGLVMVLMVAVLQLWLGMVQRMSAAKILARSRGYVVGLVILRCEFRLDQMVGHWLLMLLVVSTGGRIHQERTHVGNLALHSEGFNEASH